MAVKEGDEMERCRIAPHLLLYRRFEVVPTVKWVCFEIFFRNFQKTVDILMTILYNIITENEGGKNNDSQELVYE